MRDPDRHLTPAGREQARALGDRLRWHDCSPTHMWSSPLVRAIQTAELLARGLQRELTVESVPALAPSENPRTALALILALPLDAIVIVVGHEPGLSALGSLLVSQPEFAPLRTAQAARIVDGTLRWRFASHDDAPEIAG